MYINALSYTIYPIFIKDTFFAISFIKDWKFDCYYGIIGTIVMMAAGGFDVVPGEFAFRQTPKIGVVAVR